MWVRIPEPCPVTMHPTPPDLWTPSCNPTQGSRISVATSRSRRCVACDPNGTFRTVTSLKIWKPVFLLLFFSLYFLSLKRLFHTHISLTSSHVLHWLLGFLLHILLCHALLKMQSIIFGVVLILKPHRLPSNLLAVVNKPHFHQYQSSMIVHPHHHSSWSSPWQHVTLLRTSYTCSVSVVTDPTALAIYLLQEKL
jgi:hypothetical protein